MELTGKIVHALFVAVGDVAGGADLQLCDGDVHSPPESDLGAFLGLCLFVSSTGWTGCCYGGDNVVVLDGGGVDAMRRPWHRQAVSRRAQQPKGAIRGGTVTTSISSSREYLAGHKQLFKSVFSTKYTLYLTDKADKADKATMPRLLSQSRLFVEVEGGDRGFRKER